MGRMTLSVLLIMAIVMTSGIGLAAPRHDFELLGAIPLEDYGSTLDKTEMDSITGDGWLSAFSVGATWAAIGAGTYAVSWAWDRYVDRKPRRWSWSSAGKTAVTSGFAAGMGALLSPTP